MRIFDNFLYKLLALSIALVLWAFTQGIGDAEKSIDLPIVLDGVPEDLVVVDRSAHEINVRVRGSRAAVRTVEQDLESFAVSLSGIEEGETRLPLDARNLDLRRGAEVLASAPSTLVVRAEPVVSRRVGVRVDLEGSPPEGYELRGTRVDPPRVELAGARTAMKQVDEVQVESIDVGELRETTTVPARLLIRAANVWRRDGDEPVRVTVLIEAPEAPADEAAQGASRG